jgi:hypothetical protein
MTDDAKQKANPRMLLVDEVGAGLSGTEQLLASGRRPAMKQQDVATRQRVAQCAWSRSAREREQFKLTPSWSRAF